MFPLFSVYERYFFIALKTRFNAGYILGLKHN